MNMNVQRDRIIGECKIYSDELGASFRNLYQLQEAGASDQDILAAQADIQSCQNRLKNTIKYLNQE